MTTSAPPPTPAPAPPPPPPASERHAFRYEAQTVDGRTFRGILEAPTLGEAQNRLTGLQLRILSIEAVPPGPTGGGGGERRRPLSRDDFLLFNQQLAHLTAAGLPVERGLRLIAADLRAGRLA